MRSEDKHRPLFFLFLVPALALAACFMPLKKRDAGEVVFALYTVQDGVMKMTAQVWPGMGRPSEKAVLEIKQGQGWEKAAESKIIVPGWTAHFRVQDWDASKDVPYRVNYKGSSYKGLVRRDPVDKETIMAAAFTGNGPRPHVRKSDIVSALKEYDPDLLVFTGDQVYRHHHHTGMWIEFGMDFGDLTRDRPTITIPDDHDVGHGNLWGAGGRKAKRPTEGGYLRSPDYVNQVQRSQTWHLPDPYDPTPVKQDIGVYYTDLTWGRISFAIIEDRKWKSGCLGLVTDEMGPRPDHVTSPEYDKDALDPPGKELLGQRQLEFLREWAADWQAADMKAVVSQTLLCNLSTHHQVAPYVKQVRRRVYADLDSNGWPRSARDKALKEIRKAFAVMINGDQHLASVVHHGVDQFGDSGYSFCVPSIASYWMRWWEPEEPGKNRQPGPPDYTGDFKDGFGNRITVYAVANPRESGREPPELHDKAPGYGIIKFNKKKRTITFECWPRQTDPTKPADKDMQYKGWPVTVSQEDNYARKAAGLLPKIKVAGMVDPVVQVIKEDSNEIVYTIRIKGKSFSPKVFEQGSYTVKVGEPGFGRVEVLKGLEPVAKGKTKTMQVRLGR